MKLAARLAAPIAVLFVVATAVAPVLAADGAVSIAGQAFEPASITINTGDTVTWSVTESIDQPHSVTSGTPEDAGKVFDSGIGESGSPILQDNGQTFEHTFGEPGEYAYFCTIHPAMTGTVVVLAEGASEAPGGEPSGEPSEAPGEPEEEHAPVPTERKIAAGTILAVGIVLMFGMAWLWRRMNPA